MRSLEPADERGALKEKCPDEIALAIRSAPNQQEAIRKWSQLYFQSDGSWAKVELNLTTEIEAGRQGSGDRVWLTDDDMLKLGWSRAKVDAKIQHVSQFSDRVRADPEAPDLAEATQYFVTVKEGDRWWEGKNEKLRVGMSSDLGPKAASHIMTMMQGMPPAGLGFENRGAMLPPPPKSAAQAALAALQGAGNPAQPLLMGATPGLHGISDLSQEVHQQAQQAAAKAQEAALQKAASQAAIQEQRALVRQQQQQQREATRAAAAAEKERTKGLPETKARTWALQLNKDVNAALTMQTTVANSKAYESVKTEFAKQFGDHATALEALKTNLAGATDATASDLLAEGPATVAAFRSAVKEWNKLSTLWK
jgi:hypothetical protein